MEMYEYIKGIYAGMNKNYIIVENNGIGYKIYTSGTTIAKMPKMYDEVKLYLQQIVREDFIGLYGFLTKEELDLFNLILTINGVGSKAALSLLSISSVNNLKHAILSGDENMLIRAPGIGKKTAERIILELKDKIKCGGLSKDDGVNAVNLSEQNVKDAGEALMSLGYSQKEANEALTMIKHESSETIESIIKKCLKLLMN